MNGAASPAFFAIDPATCGGRSGMLYVIQSSCSVISVSCALPLSPSCSLFSRRGRSSRRHQVRHPNSSPEDTKSRRNSKIEVSFSLDDPATSLARLRQSAGARVMTVLSDAEYAFHDLGTSVRVDPSTNRIVLSCRRASLVFLAQSLFWGLALAAVLRALMLAVVGFQWRRISWGVVRRDRSLGGREVVVGRSLERSPVSVSPDSSWQRSLSKSNQNMLLKKEVKHEMLPEWWQEPSPVMTLVVMKADTQRELTKLVRAITDNRLSGKDYRFDDIIQLRELCKLSGAKVSFETDNARDSLYRAATNFVLDAGSKATGIQQEVQINGEEATAFISNLAGDIRLEKFRAAKIVCAAIAARTRASFLQSWALDLQGKRHEALEELLKICLIHQTFPPVVKSAEMEMVASGLKMNLQFDQRKHLFSLYKDVCTAGDYRVAAEALGLAW